MFPYWQNSFEQGSCGAFAIVFLREKGEKIRKWKKNQHWPILYTQYDLLETFKDTKNGKLELRFIYMSSESVMLAHPVQK